MSNNTLQFTINLNGTAYTGIAQIDKALNKVQVSASKTSSMIERVNNAAFKINNIIGGIQNTIGRVSGAIQKVIDVGGENELQKLNLVTLFRGNAKAADEMQKKIAQYGKTSVYDKKGLIEGISTMMQYQVSGEKAFETLKQIGDIAMGDSVKMQSLSLAFAQASAAGKLQGNDYKQMIGAGFNPLLAISERTGESIASLESRMSKGALSAKELSQAFRYATEEGGAFYKGAETAASSTMAKINELKEKYDEFLISIFERMQPVINSCIELAGGALARLSSIFNKISNAVSSLIGWFEEFMPVIAGVATAIGVLTIATNTARVSLLLQDTILNVLIIKEKAITIATNIWTAAQSALNAVMNANPIGLIISGIAILIGAIVYVCSKIHGWGSLWDGICGFMKYSFYAFVDGVKFAWTSSINAIMIGLDYIKIGWYKFKEACGLGDSAENKAMIAQINADVEARQKAIANAADKLNSENLKKAKQSISSIKMSWGNPEEEKTPAQKIGTNSQLQSMASASTGSSSNTSGMSSLKSSNEAIATGGTRNTSITINLREMIGSVSFNGGIEDNREDFERKLAESMFRVLAIAQSSVG